MTSSLRLLLEDYLGLMREEGELDVFLPLLMSAMSHEIVYRAQKGTRQYGVDIVSLGKDSDGVKKLFLWLVKCGDIARSDWDSGPQSIRQSINDVGDVYLRSHLAPQHGRLKKKLLVVTNGDFSSNLNETIAAFLESWSSSKKVEAEQLNGSALATLTEKFLLDEYILPKETRSLLRRMIANVSSPELCISVGQELIDAMAEYAVAPARSSNAQTKRLLTGLRGIRTALSVLQIWAQKEQNLLAPYRLSEYAMLVMWSHFHKEMANTSDYTSEFAQLVGQLLNIAEAYHRRMEPYYSVQDAFAHRLPESLLVSEQVFDEIGRLGIQGCICASLASQLPSGSSFEIAAHLQADRIRRLLKSHSCTALPAYDHHATNIHIALVLLLLTGHDEEVKKWIHDICTRFGYATNSPKYLPMCVAFDELLPVHHGAEPLREEFYSTTTLIPILLTWTAALDIRDGYDFLRTRILEKCKSLSMTPNFWSSDAGYESTMSSHRKLYAHGVGESFFVIPELPEDFLAYMSKPLDGVESIGKSSWFEFHAPYIPMIAALHWQCQLPREMIVLQALATARRQEGPTEEQPATD